MFGSAQFNTRMFNGAVAAAAAAYYADVALTDRALYGASLSDAALYGASVTDTARFRVTLSDSSEG